MNSRKSFHREVKMMIAEGFTCQRYGFNVGADKFSLLTIENGKTSIMRLSEWTLISQSQKSHSDRLLVIKSIIIFPHRKTLLFHTNMFDPYTTSRIKQKPGTLLLKYRSPAIGTLHPAKPDIILIHAHSPYKHVLYRKPLSAPRF